MCVTFLALNAHAQYPVVLLFNRDEYYARETAAASIWPEGFAAGRDLKSGGTWLGVSPDGRIAALTHFRDPSAHREGQLSRGQIVPEFLTSGAVPTSFSTWLHSRVSQSNGFNLIYGQGMSLRVFSSRDGLDVPLENGVHGLSNGLLNSPWPKVTRGRKALGDLLSSNAMPSPDALLDLMLDDELAADHELPKTGVPLAIERGLSPIFVSSPTYGTRSSTLVLRDRHGNTKFIERTIIPGTKTFSTVELGFNTEVAP